MTGRANVLASMWEDADFLELPPTSKVLWLYLFTGPHMKRSAGGVVSVEMDDMVGMLKKCFGKKMTQGTVETALRELGAVDFCHYDARASVLLIPGWMKHNKPQSPKNIVPWIDTVCALPQSKLINRWLEILKAHCWSRGVSFRDVFEQRFEHLFIDDSVFKKLDKSGAQPMTLFSAAEEAPQKKLPAWSMDVAREMASRLESIMPRRPRSADIERWADSIERIKRIDGHSEQDIRYVLDWTYQDNFWKGVILSGQNFRKHFARLLLGAHEQSKDDGNPFATTGG